MLIPLLASLFYFGAIPGVRVSPGLYLATKLFTLVWPLLCFWGWGRGLVGLKPAVSRRTRSLGLGAGFGLAIFGLIFLVNVSPLGSWLRQFSPQIAEKIKDMGMESHYILYAALISTVHALLEEYYWRWFVYGTLSRLTRFAHLIAGIAFAAHHVVVLAAYFGLLPGFLLGACVGIGGMFWSWLYQREGSLLGPWLSHIFVDAALMTIGYQWVFV
ncbi:MAG: CPBP family intramembrane metalloprotease [Acidobacteria bacterium]|nr:CPBP family intramembrane metalloprotease [Acidobacteriota bacterium]